MKLLRYVHFWCPKIFSRQPWADFWRHWFTVDYSTDYIMWRHKDNSNFLQVSYRADWSTGQTGRQGRLADRADWVTKPPPFWTTPPPFWTTPPPFWTTPPPFWTTPPPFWTTPPPFWTTPPPFWTTPPPFWTTPPRFSTMPPHFSTTPPPFLTMLPPFSTMPPPFLTMPPPFSTGQGRADWSTGQTGRQGRLVDRADWSTG
jgi:hypothetical protein